MHTYMIHDFKVQVDSMYRVVLLDYIDRHTSHEPGNKNVNVCYRSKFLQDIDLFTAMSLHKNSQLDHSTVPACYLSNFLVSTLGTFWLENVFDNIGDG